MSKNRGDCEHGHADQVMAFAEMVALDHGEKALNAALVYQDYGGPDAPTVIGKFNTSSLGSMALAMLLKTAEHVPDGCVDCDAMGAAAKLAAEIMRTEFERQRAANVRRKSN